MATQDTIDTLIRFKLNVPELRNDFRAIANEVDKLNALAVTAGRGVTASIAAARETIGVRAFTDIRDEIAAVNSAFITLQRTGKLSMRELEATAGEVQKRVAALNEELLRNQQAAPNPNTLARKVLGVRSADSIRADIQTVRDAYRGLAASGKLSGQELETAFSAARKRIRELRDEAQGAQFVLRRSTGAGPGTPQGPPASSQPGFLAQTALASFGRLTGAFTAAQLAANGLARSLEGLFSALAAGIVFLKEAELRALGIAGIIASSTEIANQSTTFNQSMALSTTIIERLNDAALATAANSKDLIAAFQGMIGPGIAAGLTLQNVIDLSITGVNAVKSLGLNSTQVVQELRDLVQGGIQPASSTVATALGIRDADIARFKGNGQGLIDFLNERLKGFTLTSAQFGNTFAGAFEQLKDVFTRLNAIATTPIFEGLRKTFISIVSSAVTINEKTREVTFSPKFLETAQAIASYFDGVVAAVEAFIASLGGGSEAMRTFGTIVVQSTRVFIATFEVVGRVIGAAVTGIALLVDGTRVLGKVQLAIADGLGLTRVADSLRESEVAAKGFADRAFQIGSTLLTANSGLLAFDNAMERSSRTLKKVGADLEAPKQSINLILSDGQRVAQGLQSDVNKTAIEADKLLVILERLRARNLDGAQQKQVSEQLLITRQALNRSAKDFREAFKPITDVLKTNFDTYAQGIESVTSTRAGIRNLSFEFQKLQLELKGTAEGIAEISNISKTGAFLELSDAFSRLDNSLESIDQRSRAQRAQINGSFDASIAQLTLATREALKRPGSEQGVNTEIIGLQDDSAVRQLAERQGRELAQADRASAIERRQIYEQLFQTVQGLAQTALGKYREYAQQVINLDKQIANNRLDLQTSEADIQRQGKSNPEQLASVRRELTQLRQQTAQAITQNDEQLVGQLISRRRSLARELLSLGGDAERQNALNENRAAATEQIGLLEKQRLAAAQARDQQLATFQSLQVTLSDIQGKIEQINASAISIQVAVDQASLQAVVDQVRSAISNIVATVRVQALIDTRAEGTAGFATGGHVWGAGTETSDSILARLSRNEWVMRAKAVNYWGKGFMQDINSMRMPRFAGGGAADGGHSSRDSMDLNFNLGGSSFQLSGQREQVRGLVDALYSVSRGIH